MLCLDARVRCCTFTVTLSFTIYLLCKSTPRPGIFNLSAAWLSCTPSSLGLVLCENRPHPSIFNLSAVWLSCTPSSLGLVLCENRPRPSIFNLSLCQQFGSVVPLAPSVSFCRGSVAPFFVYEKILS